LELTAAKRGFAAMEPYREKRGLPMAAVIAFSLVALFYVGTDLAAGLGFGPRGYHPGPHIPADMLSVFCAAFAWNKRVRKHDSRRSRDIS